jgi:inosine-uridine nucleoside N-ribohydrolase
VTPQNSTPQKIVFDVDTGIDDSLALLYLLGSPDEAEILAITCTSGNVPARQVALNNLNWLALCNAPEIEVALGSEVPLLAPLMTTEETHGPQGIGYAELPDSGRAISSRHATEVWIDAVRTHPGEVIGLVTGPLTNLALAVRLEPELPRLLKRLVVMGGTFDYKGNTAGVGVEHRRRSGRGEARVRRVLGPAAGALPDHRGPQRDRAHRDASPPPGRAGGGRGERAGRRGHLAR